MTNKMRVARMSNWRDTGWYEDPKTGERISALKLPHHDLPNMDMFTADDVQRLIHKSYIFDSREKSSMNLSRMAEVFTTPIDRAYPPLPLAEYLLSSGAHPVATKSTILSADFSHHYFALWEFPNGRRVSVVSGMMFHCDDEHPYEVWAQAEDEPRGYQTDEDLMLLLIKEKSK